MCSSYAVFCKRDFDFFFKYINILNIVLIPFIVVIGKYTDASIVCEYNSFKMSTSTKNLLEQSGGFSYTQRTDSAEKLPPNVNTYWLTGRILKEDPLVDFKNTIAKK